ncbi:MAG TPA: hypothetical protein VFO05_13025 [Candidatus Limnocylindrales bacterium]|nr:hypothetical protein [Candidatus Limnocylindrales bacterium]
MNEPNDRFADRLGEELGRILGTGIILEEVDLGADEASPAHIRAVCLFDGTSEVLEARGQTRQEAYDLLVKAAAELRLALASRNMIAPI